MNIIFITADQLAAGFVGCYGSGVNSTPTLDKLSEKGVRFDRCYASCPVCAPNRATFMTGRSPTVHGIVTNNLELRADMPSFTHVLQQQGYRTGGFGKFHLTSMAMPHPENLEYLGFDESIITEDPKLGAYLDWIEKEHPEHYETALGLCWDSPWMEEYGPKKQNIKPAWLKARKKIRDPLEQASISRLAYTSPLPAELHQTTYITDRSLDFMERHIAKHPGKPFFCNISYVDPHDPYDPPAPYSTMFEAKDMPDPLPATWTKRENPILEYAQGEMGNFREICKNVPEIKKIRALFHGSVRFIDDQIARVTKFLDEKNMWDDTVIVFTTDHGEMMGDHEFLTKGVKHYDTGIRCPLIVSGANVIPSVSDRLICSLDFFPTFCDWSEAAEDLIPPLEGKSFAPACAAQPQTDTWDEVLVAFGPVSSIITDNKWRLTIFDQKDNTGEMFDLKNDPDEQNNLYYDPKWTAKRTELFERLVKYYSRQCRSLHYRNLPPRDQKKWVPGSPSIEQPVFQHFVRAIHDYDI